VSRNDAAERRMRAAFEADSAHFAPYALLLRHGEFHEPRHRPADVAPGEKKYCYRNAFRLASERPELRYIEGYGVSAGFEGMPERHAWCVDRAGLVFDPTPTWADPDLPLPLALCGIALPLDFVEPYVDRAELHRGTLAALRDRIFLVTDALGVEPLR
jgi:hypothetical protein